MKSLPSPHRLLSRLVSVLGCCLLTLLVSCHTPFFKDGSGLGTQTLKKDEVPFTYFDYKGVGVPGKLKIAIDLSSQKATFTKDGKDVGWTYVAAGVPGHPSPTGSFSISDKIADKVSNKYGVITNAAGEIVNMDATKGKTKIPEGCKFVPASMPFWQRLTGYGIGMHAGPIPDPGHPASHGCIRLPYDFAKILFSETKDGTPVVITR